MMNDYKLFGNLFNGPGISTGLFLLFCIDLRARLFANNVNHIYDIIIAQLDANIAALEADVENKDVSEVVRLGKTKTVDEITADFGTQMSELHGVIAHSLGGLTKPEMLEFFPHGLTEYNNISRVHMPVFVNRINKAATKNATKLGVDLTAQLLAFKPAYINSRDVQVNAKADVTNIAPVISAERTKLELTATMIVRTIAAMYPGDVATCSSLFNFNLLNNTTHHKHEIHIGDVAKGESVSVTNITFTSNMEIDAKNTGDNSDYWLWIGAIPFDPDNGKAMLIKSGKSYIIKPSDIGDPKNTFLTIKNDSSVNSASYKIDIIR